MIVDVITLFPDLVDALARSGMVRRAVEAGALRLRTHDLRGWGEGASRQVDDTPFGGGGGMVLMPGPLFAAMEAVESQPPAGTSHRVLLSPRGTRLDQNWLARRAALGGRLTLICGRYEGVDERVSQNLADEELSLGDYVLSGGELGAMVVVEGLTRLLPGVLGDPMGAQRDSFSHGRLDWPDWTRPATFRRQPVPPVLLSGDHRRIDKWRQQKSLELTRERRPDLLRKCGQGLDRGEIEPRLTHGRTRP